MLNWPGAGRRIGSPTGSSVERHGVGRLPRAPPPGTAPGQRVGPTSGLSCVTAMPVDIEHPQPVALEPLEDDPGEALRQRVAEAGRPRTCCAGRPRRGHRGDGVAGLGVELPAVRREEPGPAQHVARRRAVSITDGAAPGHEEARARRCRCAEQ